MVTSIRWVVLVPDAAGELVPLEERGQAIEFCAPDSAAAAAIARFRGYPATAVVKSRLAYEAEQLHRSALAKLGPRRKRHAPCPEMPS